MIWEYLRLYRNESSQYFFRWGEQCVTRSLIDPMVSMVV